MGSVGVCSCSTERDCANKNYALYQESLGLYNYSTGQYMKNFDLDYGEIATLASVKQKMARDKHELNEGSPLYQLLTHPISMKEQYIDKNILIALGILFTKGALKLRAQYFLITLDRQGKTIFKSAIQEVLKAMVTLSVNCIPILPTLKFFPQSTLQNQLQIQNWVHALANQIYKDRINMTIAELKPLMLKEYKFIFNHNELRERFKYDHQSHKNSEFLQN